MVIKESNCLGRLIESVDSQFSRAGQRVALNKEPLLLVLLKCLTFFDDTDFNNHCARSLNSIVIRYRTS